MAENRGCLKNGLIGCSVLAFIGLAVCGVVLSLNWDRAVEGFDKAKESLGNVMEFRAELAQQFDTQEVNVKIQYNLNQGKELQVFLGNPSRSQEIGLETLCERVAIVSYRFAVKQNLGVDRVAVSVRQGSGDRSSSFSQTYSMEALKDMASDHPSPSSHESSLEDKAEKERP